MLEVGLEPTKREAREIYSLLSLPLDDSSNLIHFSIKDVMTQLFAGATKENMAWIVDEQVFEVFFGIIMAEFLLSLSDFAIVASVMNICTKTPDEIGLGELLYDLLWLTAVLANNTAEIALEKHASVGEFDEIVNVLV